MKSPIGLGPENCLTTFRNISPLSFLLNGEYINLFAEFLPTDVLPAKVGITDGLPTVSVHLWGVCLMVV